MAMKIEMEIAPGVEVSDLQRAQAEMAIRTLYPVVNMLLARRVPAGAVANVLLNEGARMIALMPQDEQPAAIAGTLREFETMVELQRKARLQNAEAAGNG